MEYNQALSGLYSMTVDRYIGQITDSVALDDLPFMTTYTGKQFRHVRPRPEDICIEDIAHALARVCRYTGHIEAPHYSVGQHSYLVSLYCNGKDAMAGLLHDGTEAYCTDISSPLKKLPGMEGYRIYEKRAAVAIAEKFGVPVEKPQSVHIADMRVAANEMFTFFSSPSMLAYARRWSSSAYPPYANIGFIEPWPAELAERRFLERYRELRSKQAWQQP